jgi:hypothetical protein
MLTAEMEQAKFDVQRVAEQQAMGRLLAAIPAAAIEGRFTFSPVEGGCVRMTLVVLSADGLR